VVGRHRWAVGGAGQTGDVAAGFHSRKVGLSMVTSVYAVVYRKWHAARFCEGLAVIRIGAYLCGSRDDEFESSN